MKLATIAHQVPWIDEETLVCWEELAVNVHPVTTAHQEQKEMNRFHALQERISRFLEQRIVLLALHAVLAFSAQPLHCPNQQAHALQVTTVQRVARMLNVATSPVGAIAHTQRPTMKQIRMLLEEFVPVDTNARKLIQDRRLLEQLHQLCVWLELMLQIQGLQCVWNAQKDVGVAIGKEYLNLALLGITARMEQRTQHNIHAQKEHTWKHTTILNTTIVFSVHRESIALMSDSMPPQATATLDTTALLALRQQMLKLVNVVELLGTAQLGITV